MGGAAAMAAAVLFGYASLVGAVVGAVEILQRYRDAPFRALFSGWGIGYMLLNAAVSYGTFWVLYHWVGTPPSATGEHNDPLHLLVVAAGAGFGGTTLIRARLATIRLPGGQEIGIGTGYRHRNAAGRGSQTVGPATRRRTLPHRAQAHGRHRLRPSQEAAAERAVPGSTQRPGGGSRATVQADRRDRPYGSPLIAGQVVPSSGITCSTW